MQAFQQLICALFTIECKNADYVGKKKKKATFNNVNHIFIDSAMGIYSNSSFWYKRKCIKFIVTLKYMLLVCYEILEIQW